MILLKFTVLAAYGLWILFVLGWFGIRPFVEPWLPEGFTFLQGAVIVALVFGPAGLAAWLEFEGKRGIKTAKPF